MAFQKKLTFFEVEDLLGDVLELLAVVLGQRGQAVLVHRLGQVEHLVAAPHQPLGERRLLHLRATRRYRANRFVGRRCPYRSTICAAI